MDISQLYPGRGTDSEHFLFELNCPGDLHLHWSAVLLLENLCGYFPFGLSHFCNKKKTENPNRYCWYMTYMLIWYVISILCLAWRLLLPIPLLLAVAFFSHSPGTLSLPQKHGLDHDLRLWVTQFSNLRRHLLKSTNSFLLFEIFMPDLCHFLGKWVQMRVFAPLSDFSHWSVLWSKRSEHILQGNYVCQGQRS